jgi:hypothetical protein
VDSAKSTVRSVESGQAWEHRLCSQTLPSEIINYAGNFFLFIYLSYNFRIAVTPCNLVRINQILGKMEVKYLTKIM